MNLNAACFPLLCTLVTALLSLALLNHAKAQRQVHFAGALVYLMIILALNWHIHTSGFLVLHFGSHPSGIAISFVIDYFSALMLLVTALTAFAVVLYSIVDFSIAGKRIFYPAFWFMMTGVTGAFSTGDLFNLYVWFEVMIIASFILMALSRDQDRFHGTMQYMALNLLATVVMLMAIGFLYGISGTLQMANLAIWVHHSSETSALFLVILALLMASFAMKSALFPYYFWLPASYHLTSVSAAGIFAGLLTKVGIYALIRTATLLSEPNSSLMSVLLVLSCITMFSGVFGAMADYHIRRIFSCHIISQVGYMTLGLAMGTTLALSAAVFYIVHHILVKTNLFLISGLITRYNGQVDLQKMGDFFLKKPVVVVLFLIPALSLAGFPPLSGFWAKYLILEAAFSAGFWISALVAVLVGFFTLYSMIKIWRYTFLKPTESHMNVIGRSERVFLYTPIIVLSLLTVTIGLYPQFLYSLSKQAAEALMNPGCYFQAMQGEIPCLS